MLMNSICIKYKFNNLPIKSTFCLVRHNNRFKIFHSLYFTAACPTPTSVNNAVYTPSVGPHFQDSTVTYTCNTGYALVAGDAQHSCDTGAWIGSLPTCLGKFVVVVVMGLRFILRILHTLIIYIDTVPSIINMSLKDAMSVFFTRIVYILFF